MIRRRSHLLTWLFPLLTLIGLSTLLLLDASRIGRDEIKKQIAASYGVPERTVERYAHLLPSGLNWADLAPPPAHDHDTPLHYAVFDTGVEMVFAHLGNGDIPETDRFLQTTIVLVNDSNQRTEGTIRFFDDPGNPLELPVEGQFVSSIEFTLQRGEVKRFRTDGQGSVKSGWALVHSDQPISGNLSFGIRDTSGTVFTDVGVAPSTPGQQFTIFADSLGSSNTGVGLSNPNEDPVTLHFDLRDGAGNSVASTTRDLGGKGHLALFMTELFPGVSQIQEFEGSMLITRQAGVPQQLTTAQYPAPAGANGAGNFAAVTLRVTGSQLTSLPVIPALPAGANWTNLAFPHVGVGAGGGLRIATSCVLINHTPNQVTGTIQFFNSDGTPMEVTVEGISGSEFDFTIQSGGVTRIVAESSGNVRTGWARVNMDQPIKGTALVTPTFPISAPERPSSRLRVVNDQNLSTFQPRNKRFPSYFG